METAYYIKNRTLVGPEGKTSIETFDRVKPYISHLKAWGCLTYTRLPKENKEHKIVPTSIQTTFIGY
jgi:hypothetical protein